jgi:hypothetical protein
MRLSLRWLSPGMLATLALAALGASSGSAPGHDDPMPFREYPSFEGDDAWAPVPDGWNVPYEQVVVGRLMYPSASGRRSFFGGGNDWHFGGTGWTDDYPRGDRALITMLRRNTRIDARLVEQPVSLDDGDDIFYWPFLVAGLAQSWQLSDQQAATLREYLLRGGFLFCDSFFEDAWYPYEESMQRVFPDRDIRDLTDDEAVFHVAFDLKHMTQVAIPHIREALGGFSMGGPPHWRGVFDDSGRLMVLIAHNNDVGDGWQFADDPRYPGDEANRALRIGSNVAVYALTH